MPAREITSASSGASSIELLGDEHVGDEHVAGADELEPAGGDQARVAGAGADEVDGHPSSSATRPAKYALRSS